MKERLASVGMLDEPRSHGHGDHARQRARAHSVRGPPNRAVRPQRMFLIPRSLPINTFSSSIQVTEPSTVSTTHRTKHPGNACIAIREDGRVCAVGGWDGGIRLYSTKTLKPLGTLRYHKTSVQALVFAHSRRGNESSVRQDGDDGATKEDREDAAGPPDEETSTKPLNTADGIAEHSDSDDDGDSAERDRWLIAGGKDNRLTIWALQSFERGG